jgi:alpha,alpha-trehalase
VEDFLTVHESSPMLNETEQAALYAELATGAESGWDYSVRWCKEKILNLTSNDPALRQLNARAIIPVDLTALLAGDHALVSSLSHCPWENSADVASLRTTMSYGRTCPKEWAQTRPRQIARVVQIRP